MPKISEAAGLSMRYTNHSVRVGTVTVLDSEGFSHSDISTVTGHKTIESVSRYVRNTSDAKLSLIHI